MHPWQERSSADARKQCASIVADSFSRRPVVRQGLGRACCLNEHIAPWVCHCNARHTLSKSALWRGISPDLSISILVLVSRCVLGVSPLGQCIFPGRRPVPHREQHLPHGRLLRASFSAMAVTVVWCIGVVRAAQLTLAPAYRRASVVLRTGVLGHRQFGIPSPEARASSKGLVGASKLVSLSEVRPTSMLQRQAGHREPIGCQTCVWVDHHPASQRDIVWRALRMRSGWLPYRSAACGNARPFVPVAASLLQQQCVMLSWRACRCCSALLAI